MTALARLGMVSESFPSDAQTMADTLPLAIEEERKDYFVERDGWVAQARMLANA